MNDDKIGRLIVEHRLAERQIGEIRQRQQEIAAEVRQLTNDFPWLDEEDATEFLLGNLLVRVLDDTLTVREIKQIAYEVQLQE